MRRQTIFFLAIAAALLPLTAAAQDDLTKRVEVNKDYIPDVERAGKLYVTPVMSDTTSLRVDVNYRLNPVQWLGESHVTALAPARLESSGFEFRKPFYLKTGVGAPMASLLDFYYTDQGRNSTMGAYVNHYGSWSKVVNDLDIKRDGITTFNRLGLFGKTKAGKRAELEADAGILYNAFSRYGEFVMDPSVIPSSPAPGDMMTAAYTMPYLKAAFGTDFNDTDRFNYRLAVDLDYLSDKEKNSETHFGTSLDLGKMYSSGYLITLNAGYTGCYGGHHNDHIVTIGPKVGFQRTKFGIVAGADFVANMEEDDHFWIFPYFSMSFDPAYGKIVPYITLSGGLKDNNYHAILERNPYVVAGMEATNTAEYNLQGGFSGHFGQYFGYKVYAGGNIYRKMLTFASLYAEGNTREFVPISDNATSFTIGGELKAKVKNSFEAKLDASYTAWSPGSLPKVGDMPDFDVQLSLRYNYRERFYAGVGADLIGTLYFYEGPMGDFRPIKATPVVNLKADVEYRITSGCSVFVMGNNLGCAKLYPYNHYVGQKTGAIAGVKLTF